MANPPPSGTVTFLFTDIEGSTALWENHPTQMPYVVERHDQILQDIIEAHGGYVFKTLGDACCAAFAYPREALRAALAIQRALSAEHWPRAIDLRVRMALHTGAPEQERAGDYFGPPVNRVARLLSVAHGGQILLSGASYGQVYEHPELVDEEAHMLDLGKHRLKDLTHPEQIYQLSVPDLPKGFPPLRTHEAPSNLEGERYHIKDFLGSGGAAKVYLAHDEELDREVAIKVLHPRYLDNDEFVERFKREARSAAKLSHPNIVPIYDRGQKEDGTYYMVMEYLPGGTLKDRIVREGPIPFRTAIRLTLQLAQALETAHQEGVIHRDIKPQNILLTRQGEAKLTDFGIAKAAFETTLTRTGGVLGSLHYVSPELGEGGPSSPQSDLYALGVVFYEMLTAELPYDADTPLGILRQQTQGQLRSPKKIDPNIPDQVNAVVMKLLATDPKDRYPNAAALIEELKLLLDSSENPPTHIGSGTQREEDSATITTPNTPKASSATVEVPDLRAQTVLQASNTLANSGLKLGDQQEVPSEVAHKGEIIEQTPEAGTEVEAGSLVSVTVSMGLKETIAPEGVGFKQPGQRELVEALAAVVAGIALIVESGIGEPSPYRFEIWALRLVVGLTQLIALIGLNRLLAPSYGKLGRTGIVITCVGVVIETISPSTGIGSLLPEFRRALIDLNLARDIAMPLGMGLLGAATLRARILPVWFGVVLIALPIMLTEFTVLLFAFLHISGVERSYTTEELFSIEQVVSDTGWGIFWLLFGYAFLWLIITLLRRQQSDRVS